MAITVSDAVKQMLTIVERLCIAYPHKKITLDGRLVGDIGEVLVEDVYDLQLFTVIQRHHDGKSSDGRLVQIKATMKSNLTFPADHVPDYYLGVKVNPDGSFVEVFNGPGQVAWQAVKSRAKPKTKTNLHSVSIQTLARLQQQVSPEDTIPLRKKNLGAATGT